MIRDGGKFAVVLLLGLVLGGCVPFYEKIEPARMDIQDGYSLHPQITWNGKSLPQNILLWTINGAELDRIIFVNGVEDGNPIFQHDQAASFNKEMNVIEISELLTSSFLLAGQGWADHKISNLREDKFGSYDGFKFNVELVRDNGLTYEGLASGAIIKDKLYLMFFLAVKTYYYPKYIDIFEEMISSVQEL